MIDTTLIRIINMIDKNNLQKIGTFRKTHGLQGEINAQFDIDPEFLSDEYPLIVEIEGIPVPFYVEDWRPKGATTVLIKLLDVDYDIANHDFVNKELFALKKDLAEFLDIEEEDLMSEDNLLGMEVYDENKQLLGTVEDLDTTTINELLILKNNKTEELIYLPFVEDFILEILPDQNIIVMKLPEGLIDLNSTTTIKD